MNPFSFLWNTVLYYPLVNLLIAFYKTTGSLGWSIIILTVGLRLLMSPIILPGLRLSKKMQELNPELNQLKVQFKDDKQGLAKAQAELYTRHGINPASGCLPQIIQLLVLIALFNAFNFLLKPNGSDLITRLDPILYSSNRLPSDFQFSTQFTYLHLDKPDTFQLPGLPFPLPGFFLLAAAFIQLISSKMMLPVVKKEIKVAQKTDSPNDDMMAGVQQQMLYLFPLMTILFGFQFPSGLVLYWFIFSLISMFQQYQALGWGGLTPWLNRLGLLKSPHG